MSDFIGVLNADIFRTLPPLCVSSSLAGVEGGSDQIAGNKRVNAGGIADQTFSAGEREKVTPSGHLPSSCDRPAGSKIDGKPAV